MAKLEADNEAYREAGGREGGKKLPARWYRVTADDASADDTGTVEDSAEDPMGEAGTVETADLPEGPTPTGNGPDDSDVDTAEETPVDEAPIPDPQDGDPAEDEAPATKTARLGRGVLAQLALNYLAERPDKELTASAVGKALGKSPGAVANAFEKAVKENTAVRTCEKPRRYRINVGG